MLHLLSADSRLVFPAASKNISRLSRSCAPIVERFAAIRRRNAYSATSALLHDLNGVGKEIFLGANRARRSQAHHQV